MADYGHPSTAIESHRARGAGLMSADVDVERARPNTPGTAHVAHHNNAGGFEAAFAAAPGGRAHLRRHRPAPCLYPDLDLGMVVMTNSTNGLDHYSLFELISNLDWAAASSPEGVRACRSEK